MSYCDQKKNDSWQKHYCHYCGWQKPPAPPENGWSHKKSYSQIDKFIDVTKAGSTLRQTNCMAPSNSLDIKLLNKGTRESLDIAKTPNPIKHIRRIFEKKWVLREAEMKQMKKWYLAKSWEYGERCDVVNSYLSKTTMTEWRKTPPVTSWRCVSQHMHIHIITSSSDIPGSSVARQTTTKKLQVWLFVRLLSNDYW